MFTEKEIFAAFMDKYPTLTNPGVTTEAIFEAGVRWAETEMLHAVEDANGLQWPEQAE